jgi:hypothetical protein
MRLFAVFAAVVESELQKKKRAFALQCFNLSTTAAICTFLFVIFFVM